MTLKERTYTVTELEAIVKHYNASSYSYDPVKHVLDIPDITMFTSVDAITNLVTITRKPLDIDRETIASLARDLDIIKSDEQLVVDNINLAKSLTSLVKSHIAGKDLDTTQQERYEAKANAAIANDITYFVDEAELTGNTPQALLDAVKPIALAWRAELDLALCKIDAIRVKINLIAETDKQLAKYLVYNIKQDGLLFLSSTLVVYIDNLIANHNSMRP